MYPCTNDIKWQTKNTTPVHELLYQFFVYYSDPDLKDYTLCTLTGRRINKVYFLHQYWQLPSLFDQYKFKLNTDRELLERVHDDFRGLCIQDPFDLSHNLTKAIGIHKFNAFSNLCKRTAKVLEKRSLNK